VNAQIDGVDPFSSSPHEQLKFAVYRRRLLISAMETKALLTATLAPDKAADVAKRYFELALPVGEDIKQAEDTAREHRTAQVAAMPMIPADQIVLPPKYQRPVPKGSVHPRRRDDA